ncbi:GerMN domain-containing protein [Pseudarthrobacter sp. C4D7]|uniref:GerMN domain-containing protein n=1 Tax=Pseudarthrobacter sp. C4D7 TaxID=2735268 RepID=UPI00352FF0C4
MTAYFVMVDDGGRHGIRFGCNDSLVGFAQPGDGGNVPLKAAIGALLDGGQPANAYNALGASRLTFLSGSFDGTTVTVYLSGTLNHGGSCDLPRVEAQLTQTALEATGAVKAEIYINGETLSDYLARMSRSR